MRRQHTKRRGDHTRAGQTANRVHIVVRCERARACPGKIGDGITVFKAVWRQRPIGVTAVRVARKCRMRLKQDARLDPDVIHTVGNVFAGSIVG